MKDTTTDTFKHGIAKPSLCDVTLRHILKDFEERLKILQERKQTPITLGRINETQLNILYFQQKVLDNIT